MIKIIENLKGEDTLLSKKINFARFVLRILCLHISRYVLQSKGVGTVLMVIVCMCYINCYSSTPFALSDTAGDVLGPYHQTGTWV